MGTGIMVCWDNGRIRVHDKIKMDNILLKTNIPVFLHSIILYVWQKSKSQKTNLFSTGRRISETFYGLPVWPTDDQRAASVKCGVGMANQTIN